MVPLELRYKKNPHASESAEFQAEQLCLFGFRHQVAADLALQSLQPSTSCAPAKRDRSRTEIAPVSAQRARLFIGPPIERDERSTLTSSARQSALGSSGKIGIPEKVMPPLATAR